MRLLAIDYGTKRTGIAVTDPLQIIASGLCTVETPTLLAFLKQYTAEEAVEAFVIGQPKRMNSEDSSVEAEIQKFISKLQQEFPEISIHRQDERFTSKLAFQTMIDSGLKKKQRQNKALIDEISATIILQEFLSGRANEWSSKR
ncbi:Putative Holliday junction resolvase [Capnocytophaga ochracea]|uniref:Putative pre-16S rRNA nuclease n=1 Tax=Capnocytophaga ochracea TaxID=1018 RepID=A0A2X2RPX7_CAPOC|nr:Holliday junction resolvase RuvX [Capnocytophaga ochracea]SQA78673.1 Putative Holliday junction resolvase [Capnocytophaga ochracea]